MYRPFWKLACPLVAIALSGCGGGTSSTATPQPGATGGAEVPTAGDRGTIGFSALTLKNPFFKIIADSLTAEAEKQGFKVIVNDAERDVNTQARHIDDYIAQRVTAIVINPADREAIGPAVKRANDAGIPVFTCDLECKAPGAKISGHIGTDNEQGGRLAGQAMIEALGDAGGDVLILHFAQANSCVMRVQGFREVIDKHNADRETGKITLTELEGGGLQDEGYRVTADALQAHPDLRGIFAINDPSGLGAWTALNQAGKSEQVVIVAFDGQLEGKQAIKEGKIYADPIQFPAKMGTDTVQNIVKYLDGEPFDQNVLIPTQLYKKADAEKDPELQAQSSPGTP
jgi:ribose transport system substrate-binding protein